jgi:hypothetical protein
MVSRPRAGTLLACTICLVCLACKERGGDQDSRPLPAPEPPSSPSSVAREDATAKRRPLEDDTKEAPKPKRPAEPAEPKPGGAAPSAATGGSGAGGSGTAGAPAAQAGAPGLPQVPSTVPTLTAPSAACLARCQTAMQGCLSAPVDGGVPGFGNLDLCKKAFEACQSACSK